MIAGGAPHDMDWGGRCIRCGAAIEQIEDGCAPVCALAGPWVWYKVRRWQHYWRVCKWRPSCLLRRIGL